MNTRILLVEDDRELRGMLKEALTVEGHRVQACASLADARAVWRHAPIDQAPELVLLDLGLPDGDGETLLRELRRTGNTPVIVLSARETEEHKINLLDLGADDYLVKPFGLGELLARMRAALRHRGKHLAPPILRYRMGNIDIDLAAHRVRRDGQDVHLTPTEFKLLARLVRQAGQVVTHRQLLADVWGAEHTEQTHYLRLYMGQLRSKLEPDSAEPRWLLTELGVGYRLAESGPIDAGPAPASGPGPATP